jgi:transmembrane sensor
VKFRRTGSGTHGKSDAASVNRNDGAVAPLRQPSPTTERMNENDRSRDTDAIYRAAGAWWVRIDAGGLSREERAAFAAWLAAAPAHEAAYREICGLCAEAETLAPWPVDDLAAARPRRPRLALAASLLAASLAPFLSFDELALLWRADHRTGTGETRVVTLDDGSRVELSARSAIAVDFHGRERRLSLLVGEAFFQAAENKERPFVVTAGSGTVTALGTAFDIALDGAGAEVVVAEHRVAVASHGRSAIVAEGQRSEYGPETITQPAAADIGRATAWRRGKLIFVDRPLGAVIDILSRYHRGYIIAPGAATRRLSVTGVFDVNDPLGALEEIERSLGLHAIHLTNYLVVLRE